MKNIFKNPWVTKKPSKRKQKLYKKFVKDRSFSNEKTYKNYKKFFESIKNKSKNTFIYRKN